MRIYSCTTFALVLGAATGAAAGGQAAPCATGPGASFGVTAYTCATCGYDQGNNQRPVYSFFAEPVVTQTAPGSAIFAGDVIEAVNGKPITTVAGAEQFTYPPVGANVISVRRGRDRRALRVTVSASPAGCKRFDPVVGDTAGGSGDGDRLRIRLRGAVSASGSRPLIIVDGVIVDGAVPSMNDETGRFGFAVACRPSCTAATGREGPLQFTYYRYDGFPPVVALRIGGSAARAGLKIGDLLVKIDGHLVVEDDGAMRLARMDGNESIRLTVRREGKDVEVQLRASP